MIPTPRYCPRCRRYVLCGRAEVFGRRIRSCQQCGAETKKKAPRGRPRASKPLGWKRAAAKASGGVDPDTWQAIVVFYAARCCHCEETPWRQQDHFVPLSRGGQHVASNVGPSCEGCNYRKGTQTWLPRRRHPFMEAAQ
jgi:5-methylcytosine-specific restriction endonuclease McrA